MLKARRPPQDADGACCAWPGTEACQTVLGSLHSCLIADTAKFTSRKADRLACLIAPFKLGHPEVLTGASFSGSSRDDRGADQSVHHWLWPRRPHRSHLCRPRRCRIRAGLLLSDLHVHENLWAPAACCGAGPVGRLSLATPTRHRSSSARCCPVVLLLAHALPLLPAELQPVMLEGWMANGIAAGGQLTTTHEVGAGCASAGSPRLAACRGWCR